MSIRLEKTSINTYTLLSPIMYADIVVPAGFETDGASVPKALRWFASPFTGKYTRAALVHDWLYCTEVVSKQIADNIFYNIMKEDGVSGWKASSMYYAVKYFGCMVYSKHDIDTVNKYRVLGGLEKVTKLRGC
jgi:hypothetical protein